MFLDGYTGTDGKPVRVKCLVGIIGEDTLKHLTKVKKITIKGTCVGMMDGDDVMIQTADVQE